MFETTVPIDLIVTLDTEMDLGSETTFLVSAFVGTTIMQQQPPTGAQDRRIKLLWEFSVPITSISGAVKQVTGTKK
jgi:hypothetical protein